MASKRGENWGAFPPVQAGTQVEGPTAGGGGTVPYTPPEPIDPTKRGMLKFNHKVRGINITVARFI